ncbi:g371 [Yersinia phage fHe-Yen9-04]|uniref:G371 protein n=1 Tax=Yersinia phage fHe-Yen9-04 TaxID=2052742 RepID=A0A2C9CZ50_9CAUD|nr:HNH endonuclease [Yersinia phage fHe-Yen9-04]SOK58648.1 g371 [Yersinia phage fHe-Yen9-04]VUE36417.1 g371 [Yersinia phage fHe-Yen9-04]
MECKNCNKDILNKRNKFCSKSCSASYNNKNRTMTETSKIKISEKLSAKYDLEIVKSLAENGTNILEIAKCLGVCKNTARRILSNNNIKIIKKKKPINKSPSKSLKKNPQFIKKESKFLIDGGITCSKHNIKYIFNEKKKIYECKGCNVEYVNNHRRKKKQMTVDYKGGKCQVCGYNKCLAALDFHHINPLEKDFNISTKFISFEKMKSELDKCILLCSNCHREFHDGKLDLTKIIGRLPESD